MFRRRDEHGGARDSVRDAASDRPDARREFGFRGHADVKELALYVQDTITKGSWSFNLGLRGDLYRGLSSASEAQPRLGIAYNIKPTNTVLRISYARWKRRSTRT